MLDIVISPRSGTRNRRTALAGTFRRSPGGRSRRRAAPIGVVLACLAVASPFAASAARSQIGVPDPAIEISYRVVPMPADLEQAYTATQLALLEKLNRADRVHLSRLDRLVVPDRWVLAELAYAPFPAALADVDGHRKALIVHLPAQLFAAYEYGRLARWGPVSSGRRTNPTPTGRFSLNWKSKGRTSTIDPGWYMPWYFNFDDRRGLALHQYDLPGRPASHACIRLLERDARWLFDWGEGWSLDASTGRFVPGTPLWILGQYDFDSGPPWLDPGSPHPDLDVRLARSREERPGATPGGNAAGPTATGGVTPRGTVTS